MLRITKKADDHLGVTLGLEGRIVTDWVALLEDECSEWLAEGHRIWLDFSAVTYVDYHGIERLKRLRERGVQFVNCNDLVRTLLSGAGERP